VEGDGGTVDWRGLNRANWDDRVPVHLASFFYDLDGFRGGADTLLPFEPFEVGDVAGRRLVHLQCHIGLDTLSWARRGARVSGLDFSPPAIEAVSSLAAELGIEATFVVSDVYDAVAAFGDYPYTYPDGHPLEHSRNVQFQHGIGEVTTALDAGLRIEFLHEYEFDAFR
jgi:hypothetical protein